MGAPTRAAACISQRDEELDAGTSDAFDPRPAGFAIVVVDPALTISAGEEASLRVRIERVGGFDAPVLVDLWGLPATLTAQARESRVGDDVTELTIEADPEAPPEPTTAFAIQASARGAREVARATITIE